MDSQTKEIKELPKLDLWNINIALEDKITLLEKHIEKIADDTQLLISLHYEYPYLMINNPTFKLKVTIYLGALDECKFNYNVDLHFDNGIDNNAGVKYKFLMDLDKLLRGYLS